MKHFCMKKASVEHWWNWPLNDPSIYVFVQTSWHEQQQKNMDRLKTMAGFFDIFFTYFSGLRDNTNRWSVLRQKRARLSSFAQT